MPRTGRVLLPHFPHHIVQRGHNRQLVFAAASDYQYYLDTLRIWKREYGVKVYACCLEQHYSEGN
jgi:REP-associated tyrosine transposase